MNFEKKKRQREMREQVVLFFMMVFLTMTAFMAVGLGITPVSLVPILLVLAIVQVIFQLYYFMHMKEKDHELPAMFLYGGIFVAIITVGTFVLLVWL